MKGVALLVVVGLLTFLSFVGTVFIRIAVQARAQGVACSDRIAARLLARSGVGYALARLFEGSTPRAPGTTANQPDDWIYRDGIGVPLETARNPSYAQAEPYRDVNGNGAYDDGLDGFTDLNGNARFDSWSGRLRGRYGMTGGTFALKVTGDGGKISVNEGLLGGTDLNQNRTPDFDDVGSDLDLPENRRIAHLIDTLLDIRKESPQNSLLALSPVHLPGAPPGGATAGERIIQSRPIGGYRSLEEIRSALSAQEWAFLQDYLSVGTDGIVQGATPVDYYNAGTQFYRPDRRRLVPIASADRFLLRSLFQGLAGRLGSARGPITALDAGQLADFLKGHFLFTTWYEFYAALDREKATLFHSSSMGNPLFLSSLMDIAFANANPDNLEVRIHRTLSGGWGTMSWIPPASWGSYDVVRTDPIGPFRRTIKGNLWQAASGTPTLQSPFGSQELSLDPVESRFEIESLGRLKPGDRVFCKARGASQSVATVSARVQDEFENFSWGGRANLPPGVKLLGDPIKDRTQTYPMFPLRSCRDWTTDPDYGRGSPYSGDIRLMDFSSGELHGAVFYAPMWEEGQPIRTRMREELERKLERPLSGWLSNFRDIVKGADADLPDYSTIVMAGSARLPDELAVRDLLQSGSTLSSFLCDSVSAGAGYPVYDSGAVIPGSIFSNGRYGWGRCITNNTWSMARNAGDFPMVDPDSGSIGAGTVELWTSQSKGMQPHPLNATLRVTSKVSWSWNTTAESTLRQGAAISPNSYSQPEWRHVMVAFDVAEGLRGYVDGIAVLIAEFEAKSVNSSYPQAWATEYEGDSSTPTSVFASVNFVLAPQDEIRFYRRKLVEEEAQGHAGQGRFWTRLSVPGLEGLDAVPSYTSPRYRFDRPVFLARVRWDGFVPQRVADALDPGDPAPLRVEILCYDHPDPADSEPPRWTVPFPVEFWRMGGGGIDFEKIWKAAYSNESMPRIPAFRYRVWMDVSAVSGVNNETPVFDSIEMQFRMGGGLRDAHEE